MTFQYKKFFSVVLFCLAIVSCDSPESVAPDALSTRNYVPADTVLFAGGLEPWDLDQLSVLVQSFDFYDGIDWKDIYDKERFNGSAGLQMVLGLYVEYLTALSESDTFLQAFGVEKDLDMSMYMVGIVPVARFRVQSPDMFEQLIKKIEQDRDLRPLVEEIDDTVVRRYPFAHPETNWADFIVARQHDFVVLSVDPKTENTPLRAILGIDRPSPALADTDTLGNMAAAHQLIPAYLGFIDHVQLVNLLTGKHVIHLGALLDEFDPSQDPPDFSVMESSACQTELETIARSWPRTVIGYTRFDAAAKPIVIDGVAIIEGTDPETLKSLQTLRGVVPTFDGDYDPLVEFGFGLNIEALTPFVNNAVETFSGKQYQCAPLSDLSRTLSGVNTGVLGMVGLFASGVKGVVVSLLELEFAAGGAQDFNLEKLEGLVALATDNPRLLVDTAISMLPMLEGLEVPADGGAVAFPVPMLPDAPRLAIKDKYIVLYSGEKAGALAGTLVGKGLEPNGILGSKMNYAAYFDLILKTLQFSGATAEMTKDELKTLESLRSLDASLNTSIDFTDKGIVMKMDMVVR